MIGTAGEKNIKNEFGYIRQALVHLLLVGFACLTLLPLAWLLFSSFKTTTEFHLNKLGLPVHWTTINYPMAWRIGNFTVLFVNSLFYTSVTLGGVIVLSLAASFAFAKIKSRATPFLHGSFVIGLMLTIQSLMVPLFLLAHWVGLYDTRLGVLIPYIGLGLPLGIYLCTEFIRGIPDALVESARIDGASYLGIFTTIIVPMARPVATTLAILSFAGVWNEFMLINILVSRESLKSLPVGMMRFSGALASDYGKQFAALVIGVFPTIVFYLFFHKKITQGVFAGAVKG
ncbi:MAG: carbohydrate ABC transporter permease [Firmicutes bacterium]|nr:carbohydrate ABC transporter permease [Bacillota bacterium]